MNHRNLQDSPSLGALTEADLDAAIAAKLNPLHPTIAFALMPLIRPLPPQVYRANLGRQRVFLGHRDARAYDAGYCAWPEPISDEAGTPRAMGWADHRDDAEGFAAMDEALDWAYAHAAACGVHP